MLTITFIALVMLEIEKLQPTEWNEGAYDKLVLSPGRKDMVLSFVQTHRSTREFGNDIVAGKGKLLWDHDDCELILLPGLGLVMLLNGPTGTGKTLTVESGMI